MDAVIKLDTSAPATVLGSIKDCLENQVAKTQDQIDLASLEYVLKMVTALHTMFSTQQASLLYTSFQEFIKVTLIDSSIFCPNRFKFSEDHRTIDIMCSYMNVVLLDALYNIRSLASTCVSGISSAYSLDKTHSDKKNEEKSARNESTKRAKEGISYFYDTVIDEVKDGITYFTFKPNEERIEKFKADIKKYGLDKIRIRMPKGL